jgi:hypothetical protein
LRVRDVERAGGDSDEDGCASAATAAATGSSRGLRGLPLGQPPLRFVVAAGLRGAVAAAAVGVAPAPEPAALPALSDDDTAKEEERK